MHQKMECILSVLLIIAAILLARGTEMLPVAANTTTNQEKNCIVIDAGHGGSDPGKVAKCGVLEKDINLSIALKLKNILESQDICVIMTRDSDDTQRTSEIGNQKLVDMKRRVEMIQEANPMCVISIHQNSYSDEKVKGAQCFYFRSSKEGAALAENIQKSLIARIDSSNTRKIKANDTYYLLKKNTVPTVIVECGFLSNEEETNKLMQEEFQEQVAFAIAMGVLQYQKQ